MCALLVARPKASVAAIESMLEGPGLVFEVWFAWAGFSAAPAPAP